jgi:hypothetical protein
LKIAFILYEHVASRDKRQKKDQDIESNEMTEYNVENCKKNAESIKVVVRIRPLSSKEVQDGNKM